MSEKRLDDNTIEVTDVSNIKKDELLAFKVAIEAEKAKVVAAATADVAKRYESRLAAIQEQLDLFDTVKIVAEP
jgi:hypothetical protein